MRRFIEDKDFENIEELLNDEPCLEDTPQWFRHYAHRDQRINRLLRSAIASTSIRVTMLLWAIPIMVTLIVALNV